MELIRKILFKIEDTVDNVANYNLEIEGYTMNQVAYHCAVFGVVKSVSSGIITGIIKGTIGI